MHNQKRMLKHMQRLSCELQADDGIDPRRKSRRNSRNKKGSQHRKVQQLCSRVERGLNLLLAETADAQLPFLMVIAVDPAPDASQLRVWVWGMDVPEEEITEVLERLNHAKPWLRSELAAYLSRKRVPQLCFAWKPPSMEEEG